MNYSNHDISEETQWKLNIVQRNFKIPSWIDLVPEAQEQMLREVIELSEELPLSLYESLISALEKLIEYSPNDLKTKIQNILSRPINVKDTVLFQSKYSTHRRSKLFKRQSPIKIFIRQPFTESGQAQQRLIQGVLDQLQQLDKQYHPLNLLTGMKAQSQDTFQESFEHKTGLCVSVPAPNQSNRD